MKKYMEVFRLSFKMQIIWRFDVIMTMMATIGRILMAWILWHAVFETRDFVSMFTFQSMLSYYIVSSFVASLDMSQQVSGEVSDLIRAGRFSGHMVTPMNPLAFFGSMVAGESVFHLGFSLVAAFLCSVIFGIHITLVASLAQIILAVMMIILGLMFMVCFQYFLGILAFQMVSIQAVLFVSSHLTGFATGSLVPLALLPNAIQTAMRFLPFYYVNYLPSMLLTGNVTGEGATGEALTGLFVLASWTVGFLALNAYGYHALRIKYDGVGI